MSRCHPILCILCLLGILAGPVGCHQALEYDFQHDGELEYYKGVATELAYPDVESQRLAEVQRTKAPRTLLNREGDGDEYWDLTLEEAVQIAMRNSKVIRDLGGRVLGSPTQVGTTYQPALQDSDPRFGTEGVLSAFDAQLSTSMFWEKNDRPLNRNPAFAGIFAPVFQQDLGTFQNSISKRVATGGLFSVTNNILYDANNNPTNLFPSVWNANVEMAASHPLLQGAGVQFNRIAGPSGVAGFYNGVVLARLNNDISLTDFEASVRGFVSDVENSYWDLYFAYRDLDAKIAARDSALQTWRQVYALAQTGGKGGEADKEAQAREQYFFFRGQVENALSGLPGQATISGSGSSGGTLRGAGGVYARENNLRFLLGLTANDGQLIRPADEPSAVKVEFDWDSILPEALCRRVELRRQKWVIKRRELELLASRNFLMPRLDAVGRYRWLGMGDDLTGARGPTGFGSAVTNLTDGAFQEWQTGLQFSMPLGFRQGMTAVRNAQLQLARERAVLEDQELQVSHDLSAAIREVDRSYQLVQTNFNRRTAAQQQVAAVQEAYNTGAITLDLLLDAQQRLADAEISYYRSLLDYTVAIKSVHFEKGSLLEYNGIRLAEGMWPDKAYFDAQRRALRRRPTEALNYSFIRPRAVSRGVYRQQPGGEFEGVEVEMPEGMPIEEIQPGLPDEEMPERLPRPAQQQPEEQDSTARHEQPGDRMQGNRGLVRHSGHETRPAAALSKASASADATTSKLGFDWGSMDFSNSEQTAVRAPVVKPAPPPAKRMPAPPAASSQAKSGSDWTKVERVHFQQAQTSEAQPPEAQHDRGPSPKVTGSSQPATGWKRAQR